MSILIFSQNDFLMTRKSIASHVKIENQYNKTKKLKDLIMPETRKPSLTENDYIKLLNLKFSPKRLNPIQKSIEVPYASNLSPLSMTPACLLYQTDAHTST